MRFIKTTGGEYLAVDTIAKIIDVLPTNPLAPHTGSYCFSVVTKRGEAYEMVPVSYSRFEALIDGDTDI